MGDRQDATETRRDSVKGSPDNSDDEADIFPAFSSARNDDPYAQAYRDANGDDAFPGISETDYHNDATRVGDSDDEEEEAYGRKDDEKPETMRKQEPPTKVEGAGAPMLQLMSLLRTAQLAANPLIMVNRGQKNERGFYTAEVFMHLQASLAQLAAERDDPSAVKPVLTLEPSFAGFEVPGKGITKRQTHLHAQGRISLLGVRSDFPCTLGLQVGSKLRGANNSNVHTKTGVKVAHLIEPDQKTLYEMAPRLLTHSDIGELTSQYARDYPEYLTNSSMREMWKEVKGNSSLIEVKIGSPLFDGINAARKKGAKQSNTEDYTLLRSKGDHENATGFTYAPALEVAHALKSMQKPFKERVNYVPLYEAFEFPLKRALCRVNESGAKKAKSEWLDPTEVQAKKNRGAWSDEHQKAAFNQVHSLHARFLVEYLPLDCLKKDKTEKK